MCQDAYQLLLEKGAKDFELQLALQCAPLFGGHKVSNLFITDRENRLCAKRLLAGSRYSYLILHERTDKLEFLLFEPRELKRYLEKRSVCRMLRKAGYASLEFSQVLREFQRRYENYKKGCRAFPHEMGLFLGYPVEDVQGFIQNRGQNFLYCGYWKVYGNLPRKMELFDRFEGEEKRLARHLSDGGSMAEIIRSNQYFKNEPLKAAI